MDLRVLADLQGLLSAGIALLGIAATVWLAASARRGPRHHVDNIKLAAEALEKLRVHSPSNLANEQTPLGLYIRQQETKLIDALDPVERLNRRRTIQSAVCFLVVTAIWAISWWVPEDLRTSVPSVISWFAMIAAGIIGLALLIASPGGDEMKKSRSRRRSRKRLLEAAYESAVEEKGKSEGNTSEP